MSTPLLTYVLLGFESGICYDIYHIYAGSLRFCLRFNYLLRYAVFFYLFDVNVLVCFVGKLDTDNVN